MVITPCLSGMLDWSIACSPKIQSLVICTPAKTEEESMELQNLNRRDFLRLSGLAAAGVMATACGTPPAPGAQQAAGETAGAAAGAEAAPAAGVADIPRERTLILMFGGDGTQLTDTEIGKPYDLGATHNK
jgi:hypothetical protein